MQLHFAYALLLNLSFAAPRLPFAGLPDTIKVLVSNNGDDIPRTLGQSRDGEKSENNTYTIRLEKKPSTLQRYDVITELRETSKPWY